MEPDRHDPYRTCEHHCNHDLARGVTLAELWATDGPHPQSHAVVSLSYARATLFDDEGVPIQEPVRRTG
ncbi:hypothetical protein HQ535_08830 [bacterium]|nr:hypothetical protein [bacterium]